MWIFAASLLMTVHVKGQDDSTQHLQVLQGKVIRSVGQSTIVPVKGAIVSFVEASDEDPALAVYTTIATTVSDSQGLFQIPLGQLAPTSLYAIRARGESDVWSTNVLGTGAKEEVWIKSVTITVGNAMSRFELLDKRLAAAMERDLQIRRQDIDVRLQESQIRLKLNDLETQKYSPAIQDEMNQLRAQLSSINGQTNQLAMAQENQNHIEQHLQEMRQQATVHEPGGQYGAKRVIFATDRSIDSSHASPQVLNEHNANGDLSFGLCDVAVERQGNFSNNFLHLIEDRDADRFYSVQTISLINKSDMWKEVGLEMRATSSRDALLFIHGFNVSFEDGCRRAAQIAYDIKFPGPVFLYSWPSHASILKPVSGIRTAG